MIQNVETVGSKWPNERTGQANPSFIWNTLALAFTIGSTRSAPIRALRKVEQNTSGAMPTQASTTPLTRCEAQSAMRFVGRCLFLAHPRQILTQSFKDKSTRLVAGAAELFYANALVALPFSSGLSPFSCLTCLLASLQHSPLLVTARCRHSLRHRFPAGLHYAL